MDRKLIEQYGEDILSYRLRTARQKKRMQYEDFDKQLLKLHREEDTLWKQRANLGWEPLTPPIQKGWKRFFVLREEVARSKQADFYERILKKINTYAQSDRKDFKVKKRRGSRYKKYVVKKQYLLEPQASHFAKLGFSDLEKQQFHEVYEADKKGVIIKRYVFNDPWRFVLRVRPNMIDKVRKRDSVIEARINALWAWFNQDLNRNRLNKLLYGNDRYSRWRGWKKPDVYEFKNKSFSQIMDLIREA